MYCKRNFYFDAAHRVMGHQGKCSKLHGHRYGVLVTFSSEQLDNLGMVIDFAVIKEKFGKWIEENLDHNTILYIKDKELGEKISETTNQNIYYMNSNPTAENIAMHLKNDVLPQIFALDPVTICKVEVFETPNCSVMF